MAMRFGIRKEAKYLCNYTVLCLLMLCALEIRDYFEKIGRPKFSNFPLLSNFSIEKNSSTLRSFSCGRYWTHLEPFPSSFWGK